tara:strand:+ start:45556 stop:46056 length:501 start_codon:yes stop_codon:yes gene_type:complete
MLIETKVIWIWIHLMGVILWAGGFFYVLVGLLPALQSGRTSEERVDIMRKTGILFRRISWLAIIILAVSGLFSLGARIMEGLAARAISEHPETYPLLPAGYESIMTIKLLVVIALIVHHAVRLLEPRVLPDGSIGFKSRASGIVGAVLFSLATFLGIVLLTMNISA